jgi:hypothetical protein
VKKVSQFNVMGPFEAKGADGKSVDFSHRKVQALLAYLALERSRPIARTLGDFAVVAHRRRTRKTQPAPGAIPDS